MPTTMQGNGTGTVVQPVQPPTNSGGVAPVPIGSQSPSTLPSVDGAYEDNAEPGELQSTPNTSVAPQRVPLPTNSAASGHIKRIGFRF